MLRAIYRHYNSLSLGRKLYAWLAIMYVCWGGSAALLIMSTGKFDSPRVDSAAAYVSAFFILACLGYIALGYACRVALRWDAERGIRSDAPRMFLLGQIATGWLIRKVRWQSRSK